MLGVEVKNFMYSQPASFFSTGMLLMMESPAPPPGTARCFCIGMNMTPTRADVRSSVCVNTAVDSTRKDSCPCWKAVLEGPTVR